MKTPVYKCILVREGLVETDRCGGPENGINLANAKAIILAHNHPSGDLAQSNEDYKAKALIEKAGEVLGIALVDFIVVDGLGGGVSLRDAMKTN